MSASASQVDRIVKAARSFRGVTRVDFQTPDVIDGGAPILNFPGRIYDAERQGHTFEVIGKRHKCKIFRLTDSEQVSTGASSSGDRQPTDDAGLPVPDNQAGDDAPVETVLRLFAEEHAPLSPYDVESEAA